jgi:peptidoglycan/LPS O-acetylase OafA/YrhL
VSIDNPSLGNPLQKLVESNTIGAGGAQIIYCSLYVATCITGCLAYLTLFRALANFTNKFWNSLASNSFFIYLIHYVFVIWGQYLLLHTTMSAILKFSIVFIVSLSASWLSGLLIHKIKAFSKFV